MTLASFRCDGTAILDPRLKRIAAHLEISVAQALGHLTALRCWCELMGRSDGALAGLDDEDIEVAAWWDGADGAFVRAAMTVQLLLQSPEGGELWLSPLGASARAAETDEREEAAALRLSPMGEEVAA